MLVSERIRAIQPSPTLAMNAKAASMRQAGIDVISFGVGEPDFDTPKHIRQEAVRAMEEGFTRYTAVGGTPELKDAIIEKFRRDNNLHYERDEVMVSCGGKHVLYNLAQATLNPGDEVIIPSPARSLQLGPGNLEPWRRSYHSVTVLGFLPSYCGFSRRQPCDRGNN
jgi:aspartate aminotransferase